MTKLESKQDELINWLKMCIEYSLTKDKRLKGLKKLESELAALKQGEPVSDEKECYNCHDKVKMISRGEFCPHCMCDQ